MASNKAKFLEQSLQEEMHPFAARRIIERPQEPQLSPTPKEAPVEPVESGIPAPAPEKGESSTPLENNSLIPAAPEAIMSQSIPPSVSTPARTPVRRTITRYAFEFFQDQIESLRKFSLEEKTIGEKGSMSEMVREAIDAYLAKRHRLGN